MSSQLLSLYQQRTERHLKHLFDSKTAIAEPLLSAMSYSVLLGGKRIRPFLIYSTGTILGAELADLDGPAAAMEMLHCYSLIHDDLPAMDNDDLRRGKPTCHRAFDEATAILAGDTLQALAFETLSSHPYQQVPANRILQMVSDLARLGGYNGMCSGQAIDLAHTNQQTSLAELEQMHRLKTGALIECSIRFAWLCSPQNNENHLTALLTYARAIGLAFQVQDDILDIESDTLILGKPQGSDHAANKATYPALLGLEQAKQKAQQLLQEANSALQSLPYNTNELQAFAKYVIERKF